MFKIWFEDRECFDRKYYIKVEEWSKREIAKVEFDRITNIIAEFYNTDICKELGPNKAAKQYLPFIAIENTYGKNYDGLEKLSTNIAEAATNATNNFKSAANNINRAFKGIIDDAKYINEAKNTDYPEESKNINEESNDNKMLLERISIKINDVIQKELKITSDKETEDRAIGKLIAYSNIFEMLLNEVRKENK